MSPLLRSVLYVPGSRPGLLAKVATLDADAVIVDLEDAVAPAAKDGARGEVERAAEAGTLRGGPTLMLRVNPAGTPWHAADLDLAARLAPDAVVLPKAEEPAAAARLAERFGGHGSATALMIETPNGVGRAADLAGCHPRIAALVYGSADYRLALGARPDEDRAWERHALEAILLAARRAGTAAIDAVYFRFRDLEGLERDARVSRDLGFDGKSCIHPAQVAVVNRLFSSEPNEIAWAERVLAAWRDGDGDARGVVVAGGEMIEALHVAVARRILDRASRGR